MKFLVLSIVNRERSNIDVVVNDDRKMWYHVIVNDEFFFEFWLSHEG